MHSLTLLAAFALLALALVLPAALVLQGARPGAGLADRLRGLLAVPDAGWITLADAAKNTQDDLDLAIISEFQKSSFLLDALPFDNSVNPSGGGSTLTYGYRRQITQRGAAFRPLNTEYVPEEVRTERYTVDLKPLGGAFNIDRVLAHLGPAASDEVALQTRNLIQSTRVKFHQEAILGDLAVDSEGFDGLDAALAGSATEYSANAVMDLRGVTIADNAALANDALDALDEWLALLDGPPTAIMGNRDGIARLRSLARRAHYWAESRNEFGQVIESYRGIPFVDLGERVNSSLPIVPTETRTVNSVSTANLTDLYAVRIAQDGFHGVSVNGKIVQVWPPDFTVAGAVKTGEAEFGPVAVVLKKTKAAGVLRNVRVR